MFVSWILSAFPLARIEATYRSFPDSRLLLPPSNGGGLNPAEIEELLQILRERLAESELRETIDHKVRCFFCGNGLNHRSDPCLICADHLKSGCILLGVQDGETAKARADRNHMPRRTGLCFRVSRDFIRKHWPDDGKRIVDSKGYYIDESDASRLGLLQ